MIVLPWPMLMRVPENRVRKLQLGSAVDEFEDRFDRDHASATLTGGPWAKDQDVSCARCCGGPSNQVSIDHVYYWLCDDCLALFE